MTGAAIHQQLDDLGGALVRGAVQRDAPRVRLGVGVDAEVEQHADGFERVLRRPLVRDALHPADAGRHGQCRHAELAS